MKKPGLWDHGVVTGGPVQKPDWKKWPGLSDSNMVTGGLIFPFLHSLHFFQCFPQLCKYFFDISFYLFLQLRGCLIFFLILYFRSRFNFISRYALKVSLSYGFPIQPYSPFTQCANTFLSHCKYVIKAASPHARLWLTLTDLAGEWGCAVHNASRACLPQRGVTYILADRGRFGLPWHVMYSSVFPA